MRKLFYSITLIGLSFTLTQCTAKKAVITTPVETEVVTIAQQRWPAVTQADLNNGRKIFETKCTKCHAKKTIMKKNEEGWQKAIDKMSPRAKLTPAEKELLTHYIFAMHQAGKN